MTYLSVDALVEIRARLTNRRDEQIDFTAVDLIDEQLSNVPAGERNDVDLLLGRTCAKLVTALEAEAARRELQPETVAMIEQTRIIYEQAEPIEY